MSKNIKYATAIVVGSTSLTFLGIVWLFMTLPAHDFVKWYGAEHVKNVSVTSWICVPALILAAQYYISRKAGNLKGAEWLSVLPIASMIGFCVPLMVAVGWWVGYIPIDF